MQSTSATPVKHPMGVSSGWPPPPKMSAKAPHPTISTTLVQWPGPELNRRHLHFQCSALPTELPGQVFVKSAIIISLWQWCPWAILLVNHTSCAEANPTQSVPVEFPKANEAPYQTLAKAKLKYVDIRLKPAPSTTVTLKNGFQQRAVNPGRPGGYAVTMTGPPITPEMLLVAYRSGIFPMARDRNGPIDWYSPDPRAIQPLHKTGFHVPASLAKRMRSGKFQITYNAAFDRVIHLCAEPRPTSEQTWISPELCKAYQALHRMHYAHSVEAWDDREQLVGGLYGVSLGGAFFGESMFSRASDASKICLVHLVEHLRQHGFALLDVQFHNEHLAQFGIIEIPRQEYLKRLEEALHLSVSF